MARGHRGLGGLLGSGSTLIGAQDNLAEGLLFTRYSGDFTTADLHFQSGSPCIDAGTPELGDDPGGSAPDMGAYGGPDAWEK